MRQRPAAAAGTIRIASILQHIQRIRPETMAESPGRAKRPKPILHPGMPPAIGTTAAGGTPFAHRAGGPRRKRSMPLPPTMRQTNRESGKHRTQQHKRKISEKVYYTMSEKIRPAFHSRPRKSIPRTGVLHLYAKKSALALPANGLQQQQSCTKPPSARAAHGNQRLRNLRSASLVCWAILS